MRPPIPRDIADIAAFSVDTIVTSLRDFAAVCAKVSFEDPAARVATSATIAVLIATLITFAMHLDDPWWATISAYMATQRSGPASIQRAILRIAGTVAGAVVAVIGVDWLAYDIPACCLAIFVVCTISVIGNNVSRFGYSWLLVGLTFTMVAVASLGAPERASTMAIFRVLEVAIGSGVAALVAFVLEPAPAVPPPVAQGWSGLLGPKLFVTLHAMRWSVAVALLPLVWRYFEVTDMSQMAVTVVIVLATPAAADPGDTHRQILAKGLQRLLGCLMGGIAGLLLLGLGVDSTLPYLMMLALPVWFCSFVQNGTHGVTYLGTQAGFVLIVTLVQGAGPPESLVPGIQRLIGIFFGLLILMVVVLLTHPPAKARPAAAE